MKIRITSDSTCDLNHLIKERDSGIMPLQVNLGENAYRDGVDITPEDIDAEAPLFGEGLGLDSIDALEIILILEKNYGVRLANSAEAKPVFYSVKTLAEYVMQNRK